MKTLSLSILAPSLVLALLVVGCSKDAPKDAEPAPKNAASAAGTTNAAPVTPSAATAPAGTGLAADASGALSLTWKVSNGATDEVVVALVAGDQTIPVGKLNGSSDDAGGKPVDTCAMKNIGTTSKLECGATPAFNYYTASISGGSLVITETDGIDPGIDPTNKPTTKEVLRRPTTATSLKATGPASKALYGECRAGFVQKKAGAPCMRQCLKGTGCKATEKCELTAVEGTDGPHKVSACVPK